MDKTPESKNVRGAPSVRRLPQYLMLLRQERDEGYISGSRIAEELGLEPIQVRKDLAITGITGRPRRGYPVGALAAAIEKYLSWDTDRAAALVGAGNLGTALLGYTELPTHRLRFIAAFDVDPAKIGEEIRGVPVYSVNDILSEIPALEIKIAVLTVPASEAQKTAEILALAGIRAIWNFTRVKLKLPPEVIVQNEDISAGYALMCVKINQRKSVTP
jgi:redox-sensing transcriptional repressor